MFPNSVPTPDEDSFWELFPAHTAADRIRQYAEGKGLKIGIYMGTAGNGLHGNSALIPYGDVPQWKKIDAAGKTGEENCLGDDSFVERYIRVQKNTIGRYHLSLWNWDPGPGNAMFCFNPNHRHLPGKGAYVGFRNSLRVMKELKNAFPGLYYMAFHGSKEYGLWGFREVDQHEAFWENDLYYLHPMFPDLSVDRATADGIRLQSCRNYYFRFMPAALNHGLVHRMIQECNMKKPRLNCLTDRIGWKFALLSAIAVGGPVTMPIVPDAPEKIKDYLSFYREWIDWARVHFPYSRRTIPFGSQPGCGTEGYAKLIDHEGYIFAVNGNPWPSGLSIPFTRRIGIREGGERLRLDRLWPLRGHIGCADCGGQLSVTLAPYSVQVLRVSKASPPLREEPPVEPLPRLLIPESGENGTIFRRNVGGRGGILPLLGTDQRLLDPTRPALALAFFRRRK